MKIPGTNNCPHCHRRVYIDKNSLCPSCTRNVLEGLDTARQRLVVRFRDKLPDVCVVCGGWSSRKTTLKYHSAVTAEAAEPKDESFLLWLMTFTVGFFVPFLGLFLALFGINLKDRDVTTLKLELPLCDVCDDDTVELVEVNTDRNLYVIAVHKDFATAFEAEKS